MSEELENLRINAEALVNLSDKLYGFVLGLDPRTSEHPEVPGNPDWTRKLLAEISRVAANAEGYLSAWESS